MKELQAQSPSREATPEQREAARRVAKLEVVGPPRAIVNPSTGAPLMPLGSAMVDTRTGRVLIETPSGYMDPVSGRLIPR